MMEQKEPLIARMEDLAEKAVKSGCAASRFLTPVEARSVSEHFTRRRGIALSFEGGFEGAERKRAAYREKAGCSYVTACITGSSAE